MSADHESERQSRMGGHDYRIPMDERDTGDWLMGFIMVVLILGSSSARSIVMVSRPSPSRIPLNPVHVDENGVRTLAFPVNVRVLYWRT